MRYGRWVAWAVVPAMTYTGSYDNAKVWKTSCFIWQGSPRDLGCDSGDIKDCKEPEEAYKELGANIQCNTASGLWCIWFFIASCSASTSTVPKEEDVLDNDVPMSHVELCKNPRIEFATLLKAMEAYISFTTRASGSWMDDMWRRREMTCSEEKTLALLTVLRMCGARQELQTPNFTYSTRKI